MMIKMEGVTKNYQAGASEIRALRGISLEIKKGEFVAITGPSGSGKSTLLHIIGCLDHPSSGAYYLEDRDVRKLSDDALSLIRARKIGFIFQFFSLVKHYTILRNLEIPLMFAEVSPQEKRKAILSDILQEMDLKDKAHFTPNEVSGGEQQRVEIARALINNPELLLADEPTGNLDSENSAKILSIFEGLNRKGMTVILVTHDERVARHARRIVTLRDGKVVS